MDTDKSNIDFVIPEDKALSYSENNGFGYPNMNPNYLTKKNLWDSSWLENKYPSRFEGSGSWNIMELEEDKYDPALYPNRLDK